MLGFVMYCLQLLLILNHPTRAWVQENTVGGFREKPLAGHINILKHRETFKIFVDKLRGFLSSDWQY
jgi:hypothetical protein